MTDGTAGWFRDPNDPALARWHDGERWTEHTLVIADQAPGSEPPPPVTAAVPATTTFESAPAYGAAADGGLASRTRGLPGWAKVAAPLAVIALIAAAFFLTSGDDEPSTTETAGTENASLEEAVDAARRAGLDDAVSDTRAATLIQRICDAATDPSEVDELGEDLAALPAESTTELRQQISALGAGAERRCPSDLEDEPGLIDDLQDQALVAFSTTTTAPGIGPDGTGSTVPGEGGGDGGDGTDGGSGTTGRSTGTTRKPTTGTTARPATTTTTRPLPVERAGFPCSSEGARAQTKGGEPLTCTKGLNCFGSLKWKTGGPCTPQAPIDTSGATVPPPTTGGGTTTGGDGGP